MQPNSTENFNLLYGIQFFRAAGRVTDRHVVSIRQQIV